MKQAFNPYLPSWEYVPDGEPRVFGDRVYIYGSHDRFGAPIFCVNDYVCWSASVDDLTDWKYEGVIYKKRQDPTNKLGIRCLYAPDVVQGPDGRYYIYYAFDFLGRIGVAVCDTPAGKYTYYGTVKFQDGHVWGTRDGEDFPFDPGVLVDDGKVYLYSGCAMQIPRIASRGHALKSEAGVVVELESDMVTIKRNPVRLFPVAGRKGAFEGHAFFEASSIRKIDNGKYCFVYSSEHNHELCYAISDSPMGPFVFGGTLIDIGDMFLNNINDEKRARNYLGNTHGSICKIKDQWYVFYHRQTNQTSYARQACAEKLVQTADGGFKQAELTSCGLNDGPLKGIGYYEARIACNLWSKDGVVRYDKHLSKRILKAHPYFTQSGKDRECDGDQYISNMRSGSTAGFKYYSLNGPKKIEIDVRGMAKGKVMVYMDDKCKKCICEIEINSTKPKTMSAGYIKEWIYGVHPLFFRYEGRGALDFYGFRIL